MNIIQKIKNIFNKGLPMNATEQDIKWWLSLPESARNNLAEELLFINDDNHELDDDDKDLILEIVR